MDFQPSWRRKSVIIAWIFSCSVIHVLLNSLQFNLSSPYGQFEWKEDVLDLNDPQERQLSSLQQLPKLQDSQSLHRRQQQQQKQQQQLQLQSPLFLPSQLEETIQNWNGPDEADTKSLGNTANCDQAKNIQKNNEHDLEDTLERALITRIQTNCTYNLIQSKLFSEPLIPRSERNEFRRLVQMYNPNCFEQYQEDFVKEFTLRGTTTATTTTAAAATTVAASSKQTVAKHLNLHIPKAGGTTICQLAQQKELRESNFTTEGMNCWSNITGPFAPIWCCCVANPKNYTPPSSTCPELDRPFERISTRVQQSNFKKNKRNRGTMKNNIDYTTIGHPSFVMNENYLDYPFCGERIYSIVLRHPIDRSISHVHHLQKLFWKHETAAGSVGWRLNMGQSNYITWSLVAGRYKYPYISNDDDDSFHSDYQVDLGPNTNNTKAQTVIAAPHWFSPTSKHLKYARSAIRKFDFLIDLFNQTENRPTCTKQILHMMGLLQSWDDPINTNTQQNQDMVGGIGGKKSTPGNIELMKRNVAKNGYEKRYNRRAYEKLNDLDIPLFEYAQELIALDCLFYQHLRDKETST